MHNIPSDDALRRSCQRMMPSERTSDAWTWAAGVQLQLHRVQKVL
jgi:hypothetical protein